MTILDAESDALNARLARAEALIAASPYASIPADVTIDAVGYLLWCKRGERWGLCVRRATANRGADPDAMEPIQNAPRATRIAAAAVLGDLFAEMQARHAATRAAMLGALANVDAFLASFTTEAS